ncbi:MAG: sulfotransferase [Solirubrobacterales bacterium]|nr:sulfotransferase [Solirubrobacterales bacterium]
MALPNFFVIGAPKAGTTSLHTDLDRHPQIQMSAVKEPRFFAGPKNGIPFPADHVASRQEYEALFDPDSPVRGESSTDYATHPRRTGVPERIKELVPEARFVYMVRDPVDRTISHYRMRTALLGERRPLAEALADLSDLRCPYVAPSLYGTQLDLFLRHFPAERILVLDQADLRSDRAATLAAIHRFLDVDDWLEAEPKGEMLLSSSEWRTYPAGYAGFIARFVAPHFQWVPKGMRKGLRNRVERVLWQPLDSELSDDLRTRLQERFAPEAARLRELTGKGFETWSV